MALEVLVVQNPDLLLAGIEAVLAEAGYVVVAVALGAEDAIGAIRALDLELVVVGPTTAGSGPGLLRVLRAACPEVGIVIVSDGSAGAWLHELGPGGAVGLCRVQDPSAALATALRAVAGGTDHPADWRRGADRSAVARLTPAERRVLTELATSPDSRGRLAARLGVSTSTLDSQLAAIKRKVGEDLAEAGTMPSDGFLSTEALIGWAIAHGFDAVAST